MAVLLLVVLLVLLLVVLLVVLLCAADFTVWDLHRETADLRAELQHKERRLETAIARDINRGLTAVKKVTQTHKIQ